jgi:biopolymer transport protein ExbD
MPKFKKPRVGVKLDMTPMVDIAFLLLTFFMLTTSFRPPELPEAQVILPTSNSDIKLPESDVMQITVNKDGGIYMSVDQQGLREKLFLTKIQKDWDTFSPQVKAQYGSPDMMAKLVPSYPIKVEDLGDILIQARITNPKLRTVIKGDKDADYGPVIDIMDILLKTNITRFNLLTDLERN